MQSSAIVLPANPCQQRGLALILQGGGARAAYQVGVLKALRDILGDPVEDPFPIICGTSAGAINAAVLAVNADNFSRGVEILVDVWSHFSPDQVYRTDFSGVAACSSKWLSAFLLGAVTKNRKVSLFDNSPLSVLFNKHIDLQLIDGHIASGKLRAVCVSASGYTSGQNCAFFQGATDLRGWKRSQRVGIQVNHLRHEHLLASSAIPFAFPAIKINREFFGDGSIRQIAPVSPALHLGAERVFVVGTAKLQKETPERTKGDAYPSLAQIAGHMMSSIFLDTLAVDIERLQRINATLTLVDPERQKASAMNLRHIDVIIACPQESLDGLAHRHVNDLPWTTRFLLRSIGAMRRGGAALASYMLFDKNYCCALIDMGYRDLIARRDEVRLFFDPAVCPLPALMPTNKLHPNQTFDTAIANG